MESTLKNMVLTLLAITFVASACVGAVDMITRERIAQARREAEQAALRNVLPPFDATAESDLAVADVDVKIYTATLAGRVVGYAVRTTSKNGFGGDVKLMVGLEADGTVRNIDVLEQKETPGLGTKMCDEGNPLLASFKGKNPAEMVMRVRKDGGDVDALTAATISSRAYTEAVERAYGAYMSVCRQTAAGEQEAALTAAGQKGDNDGE